MALVFLVLSANCRAQPTFSTEVKVVAVLATVRDRDAKHVNNLTKDDFTIEEDGRPQTILYFSQQTDAPVSIGLLVDASQSQRHVIEASRRASYSFLDQILRADRDAAFVVQFDYRVRVLQGFTSSRENLQTAIYALHVPWLPGTKFFDAIKRSSDQLMKPRQGRKAFILLSDGCDVLSRTSITNAIESAQRADTIIYSLLLTGGSAGPEHPGRQAMQRLATETGGDFFQPWTNITLAEIYERIQNELRNQYSIGYISDRADTSGAYRKIRLTTNRKDVVVQTRDGYYPK